MLWHRAHKRDWQILYNLGKRALVFALIAHCDWDWHVHGFCIGFEMHSCTGCVSAETISGFRDVLILGCVQTFGGVLALQFDSARTSNSSWMLFKLCTNVKNNITPFGWSFGWFMQLQAGWVTFDYFRLPAQWQIRLVVWCGGVLRACMRGGCMQ